MLGPPGHLESVVKTSQVLLVFGDEVLQTVRTSKRPVRGERLSGQGALVFGELWDPVVDPDTRACMFGRRAALLNVYPAEPLQTVLSIN